MAILTHASLFSGIGGFDLAAEWMGWDNIFHCENNEFCNKILKQHFPKSLEYNDIKTTDFKKHYGQIDIITGGFPCQPFSTAGQRRGTEDDRYLWPEMLRAIREIKPKFIVGENVYGIINWSDGLVFNQIHTDLETEGYEVQAVILPACGINAPHRRYRTWFIANYTGGRLQKIGKRFGENIQLSFKRPPNDFNRTDDIARKVTKRNIGEIRNGDGISDWMDRIKGLGNAIVPQVAYQIFKALEECQYL